jgi:Uma2 family endonuclease
MSILPSPSTFGLEPAWEVARLFPMQGKWSVDDYLQFTDGVNQLVEYSAGKVEVLEMPTTAHQRILIFLFKLMSRFVDDRELGEVMIAALRVQVAADVFREPDIVFVGRENRSHVQDRFWTGADLVVEIVSDDAKSRERDYVTKRADYAAAGIPEYWIVDPIENCITVLSLAGTAYALVGKFGPGEHAASKLLDGFTVDVAATFKAAEGSL